MTAGSVPGDDVERLRRQLGELDPRQIAIWRSMSGARRLDLVGQAYHLALEMVRETERKCFPDLPEREFMLRVIRRMHGDPTLCSQHETAADE